MRWSLLVLLLGSLVTGAHAEPNQAGTQPVTIAVHLDKTEFGPNEPMDVTVSLINESEQTIFLGDAFEQSFMYHLVLKDEQGSDVKFTRFWHPSISNYFAFSHRAKGILPKHQSKIVFPLRRMYDFGGGGTFSLTVSRDIPTLPIQEVFDTEHYGFKTYALTATPVQFSVAPTTLDFSLYRPFNASEAQVGARLETAFGVPESPVWLDLEDPQGISSTFDVHYVIDETKMSSPNRQFSYSPVPRLQQGDALLASLANQKRVRLDLAQVFDLSRNSDYVLKITSKEGEVHELTFSVYDRSPIYKWWEQRCLQWTKMFKLQDSPIEETKAP